MANPTEDYNGEKHLRVHPLQVMKHYWQKMLEINDTFVMYKFSITPYIYVPYMHVQVRLGVNFSTSAFDNSITFEDFFSLRDMLGLHYFNNMKIEELKHMVGFTESYIFNSHDTKNQINSKTLIGKIWPIKVDSSNLLRFSTANVSYSLVNIYTYIYMNDIWLD